MAKFCDLIGYAETVETSPGVYVEKITKRRYFGDVTRNAKRYESGSKVNDDLTMSQTISILADAYAYKNYANIRYVQWMGARWKAAYVEVLRPRINITVGGVYNGEED